MKGQGIKITRLITTACLLITTLPATANLIQSKVLAYNQSSQGFGDLTGVHENFLSTASYYQTYPDGGKYRGTVTTGFGWAQGQAESQIVNGGMRLYSTFIIDDITISYTGFQDALTHVAGPLHVSYAANFASHLNGNSTFSMQVSGIGIPYTAQTLYAGSGDTLNGVWEIDGLFAVGSNFSIQVKSELSIGNSLPDVQSAAISSSGGFSIALGGSPVFNLPEFYSANSADGSIVNNMYVGFNPLAPKNDVTVREPSTIFLFMSGLIGWVINRRRIKSVG